MKKRIVTLVALTLFCISTLLSLAACGDDGKKTTAPTTTAPTTTAPITTAPNTTVPSTTPPSTTKPATIPPITTTAPVNPNPEITTTAPVNPNPEITTTAPVNPNPEMTTTTTPIAPPEPIEPEGTEGLVYSKLASGDYAVTGYEGDATEIVIPSTYKGKAVTNIAAEAFEGYEELESVWIGNNVTRISDYAFYYCENLQSVTIGTGLSSIGDGVFLGNLALTKFVVSKDNPNYQSIDGNLYSKDGKTIVQYSIGKMDVEFNVPEGVTAIGDYAFCYAFNLVNVSIPSGVASIGDYAFAGCYSLLNVTIAKDAASVIGEYAFVECENLLYISVPLSVASIGAGAFEECFSLENVYYEGDSSNWRLIEIGEDNECLTDASRYDYEDFVPELGTPGLKYTLLEDDTYSVTGFDGEDVAFAIVIPTTYNGKTVTTLNASFRNCRVLVIPESIVSIQNYITMDTNLAKFIVSEDNTNYKSVDGVLYSKDGKTLIKYPPAKRENEFAIPNGVTDIASWAFMLCGNYLSSVTMSADITNINDYAFCESEIKNVTIGSGVKTIGYKAFCQLPIQHVYIPDSVESIGEKAFAGCQNLERVVIGNGVTSIGASAFEFEDCESSIRSVTIGRSVKSIGDYAFYGCERMIEVINHSSLPITAGSKDYGYVGGYAIEVHNEESKIEDVNGYLFYTYDGAHYLLGYTGNETALTLPQAYQNEMYAIHNCAFYYCDNLTSVTIPDGVMSIGDDAFYNCDGLTNVIIGNGVTSIGAYAFYSCDNLTSVTISDRVTSIGQSAFQYCDKLTYNEYDQAFYLGNSQNLYIALIKVKSDTVTCTIHDNTKFICDEAFMYCTDLESIAVSENNTHYKSIGENLYSKDGKVLIRCTPGKTIGEFAIPNGVTSIGNRAFYNCINVTRLTLPNSVTSIGDSAFSYCTSLASVTIPNSVTSIGDYAFYNCISLASVTIPNSVTSIGDDAFYYCKSLTSVTIGSGVMSIGNRAFSDCTSLTGVTIGSGVTSVGDSAFDGCTNLTGITIPSSIISIGNGAFRYCTSLASVTIPNSVKSIGAQAFRGCTSLASVTIPNSVTSIGNYAFYECKSLANIMVSETNVNYKSIDGNLYSKDGKTLIQYAIGKTVAEFAIPDSVTSIGAYAFYDCESLVSVTIGSGVTNIGNDAFWSCDKLFEVINRSTLSIVAGSRDYGYVGYYAFEVHAGDSKIDDLNGYLFYTYEGEQYLLGYIGSENDLTLPERYQNGMYRICDRAFCECDKLMSITIPDSVTNIGDFAFYYCTNLTSVTIPSSVTNIGDYAFYACDALELVRYTGSAASWAEIEINDYGNDALTNATIYCIGGQNTQDNVSYSEFQAKWYAQEFSKFDFSYANEYYTSMKNDEWLMRSINAWEKIHFVADPDYESGEMKKQDLYMLVIYELLTGNSGNFENPMDLFLNESTEYMDEIVKAIFGKEYIDTEALKEIDPDLYLETTTNAEVFVELDIVADIFSVFDNLYDALEACSRYQAISNMSVGFKNVLLEIYNDTSNDQALRNAAYECIECFENACNTTLEQILEKEFSEYVAKDIVINVAEKAWENVITAVFPQAMAPLMVAKLTVQGVFILSDTVLNLSATNQAFYELEVAVGFENALRKILNNKEFDYSDCEKRETYLYAVEAFQRTVLLGLDYSAKLLQSKVDSYGLSSAEKEAYLAEIETIENIKANREETYRQFEEISQQMYRVHCDAGTSSES